MVNLRVNLKTRLLEVIKDPAVFKEIDEVVKKLREEDRKPEDEEYYRVNFDKLIRYQKPQKIGINNILNKTIGEETTDQNTYYVKNSEKIRNFSWDKKKEEMFRRRKSEARVSTKI